MAHVLVVDDEADFRTIIAETLTWAGHDVTTAADVREARTVLASEHPDVVIADLNLGPGPTGVVLATELAAAAQTSLDHPPPAVIACSGHPDLVDLARESGAFWKVMEKPCDLDALIAAVNAVGNNGHGNKRSDAS